MSILYAGEKGTNDAKMAYYYKQDYEHKFTN